MNLTKIGRYLAVTYNLLLFTSIPFQISEDIMLNFGIYFVFLWNCQDYASWLLMNLGVQFQDMSPTVTDKLTGSGLTGHQVR